jgi:hypothetical protein
MNHVDKMKEEWDQSIKEAQKVALESVAVALGYWRNGYISDEDACDAIGRALAKIPEGFGS